MPFLEKMGGEKGKEEPGFSFFGELRYARHQKRSILQNVDRI